MPLNWSISFTPRGSPDKTGPNSRQLRHRNTLFREGAYFGHPTSLLFLMWATYFPPVVQLPCCRPAPGLEPRMSDQLLWASRPNTHELPASDIRSTTGYSTYCRESPQTTGGRRASKHPVLHGSRRFGADVKAVPATSRLSSRAPWCKDVLRDRLRMREQP